jgi:hypothetical protein
MLTLSKQAACALYVFIKQKVKGKNRKKNCVGPETKSSLKLFKVEMAHALV